MNTTVKHAHEKPEPIHETHQEIQRENPRMRPTIGRVVHFKLTNAQVDEIAGRRTTVASVQDRIKGGTWPVGIQAHIGAGNSEGDVLPMIITRIHLDQFGPGIDGVSGQVFLDGNDSFWVENVAEGKGPGQWAWPARA
jgi:hypothetical protein